jgi:uncharacterized repeat protein (TIGR03803 family)
MNRAQMSLSQQIESASSVTCFPKAQLCSPLGRTLVKTRTTMSKVQCSSILQAASTALPLAVVLLLAVAATPWAQAQYEVLYRFDGKAAGGVPFAGVIRDAAGNLYGTTEYGGDLKCFPGVGCGVVFKLNSDTGEETVLYTFTGGTDGAGANAGLIRDAAGNLYGTTPEGGHLNCSKAQEDLPHPGGCGVVFKLDTTGKETVLHSFTGGADGSFPEAGVIRDAAGNLYGTTSGGGDPNCVIAPGCGVVFKLDTTGKETVLYAFTGESDGAFSTAVLIRDAAGNLYGTAENGGDLNCILWPSGCGVVFKLKPDTRELTTLYAFTGGAAGGAIPYPSVIQDPEGNLYGTTEFGGYDSNQALGFGVVFKLDTAGKETVLYTFTGGADGSNPLAGVIRDAAGNLYGTTPNGGDLTCGAPYGCGVVFKLDTTGRETVLHTFAGGADGAGPSAGLNRDAAGNLYGTTSGGGDPNCDCGVVFKLTP